MPNFLTRRAKSAGAVRTNTIENVFSVFKRGMIGVYQRLPNQADSETPAQVQEGQRKPRGLRSR